MNLAVVIVIASTLVWVAVTVRACYNDEVDNLALLMIVIAVTFLVAGAIALHNEECPEDYTQDCVCSCECCERSETE